MIFHTGIIIFYVRWVLSLWTQLTVASLQYFKIYIYNFKTRNYVLFFTFQIHFHARKFRLLGLTL